MKKHQCVSHVKDTLMLNKLFYSKKKISLSDYYVTLQIAIFEEVYKHEITLFILLHIKKLGISQIRNR